MVDIQSSNPETGQKFTIRAKIDTGADLTDIPQILKERLDLLPFSEESIRYADGRIALKTTYLANFSLDAFDFEGVEVTASNRNYVLIGRNILNQLKLICDGKTLTFTIVDP
jgi:predicted aspartyl protease